MSFFLQFIFLREYLDQKKIQDTSDHISEQTQISKNQSITQLRQLNIEEKREWIEHRQRLHKIIGLDRIDSISSTKISTIESMLKTQRDNFGITIPILGQFVRKYMQHRPRSTYIPIEISNGKVRKTFFF